MHPHLILVRFTHGLIDIVIDVDEAYATNTAISLPFRHIYSYSFEPAKIPHQNHKFRTPNRHAAFTAYRLLTPTPY
jgi:hypothetical protein